MPEEKAKVNVGDLDKLYHDIKDFQRMIMSHYNVIVAEMNEILSRMEIEKQKENDNG